MRRLIITNKKAPNKFDALNYLKNYLNNVF